MDDGRQIAAAGCGLLALALGAATILGVVRPPEGGMAGGVPVRGIVALLSGVVAMYFASSRGYGRQLAVLGTAVALVGLILFGGALALELMVDDIRAS